MLTLAACGMGNRQTSSVWEKNEDTLLVIAMLCLHVPKIRASPAVGEGLYSLDKDQQLVHREKKQREGWFADDLLFCRVPEQMEQNRTRGNMKSSRDLRLHWEQLLLLISNLHFEWHDTEQCHSRSAKIILCSSQQWTNFVITQDALRAPGHEWNQLLQVANMRCWFSAVN